MKILYGVQATGNGHITRARAMNKYLQQSDKIEVDYLFSGRPADQFFDMEAFGDYRICKGLTFAYEAGRLKFFKTAQKNNLLSLWNDIRTLDLDQYDLVLTDYEPITAWASKLRGKHCIGVGHQYAFGDGVPKRGADLIPKTIMKNFAPVKMGLGLHWHHFNNAILPPIAEVHPSEEETDKKKIVVYLGFESANEVIQMLEPFDDYLFCFYGPYFSKYESRGHIQLKPLSREGFKHDLATSSGVICNAGFELTSEAIQLGKKVLLKPLHGQMEQLSNAKAIEELGLGMAMDSLDKGILEKWLEGHPGHQVVYPDVAQAIVEWIENEKWNESNSINELVKSLWKNTDAKGTPSFDQLVPNI